jgi:UDP-glucose 4-epimerase
MEPPQQRLGDAPRALDLVGCSGNLRPELAGAVERVRTGLDVHASPQAFKAIAAERPGAVNRLVGRFYACTKLIGESLCGLYGAWYGIQGIALRYSTVYGERQHYRGVNALYIMENYDRIMRGEPPVIPDDGSEVHDYIHVADVARANVMAMASDVTGESFNVVTGVATTLNRIVELVLQFTGSSLKPEYKTGGSQLRASATKQLGFVRTKIEKMLGWTPEVPIEQGIRRLLEWRKSQKP